MVGPARNVTEFVCLHKPEPGFSAKAEFVLKLKGKTFLLSLNYGVYIGVKSCDIFPLFR